MMDFYKFKAHRLRATPPDLVTMLTMLGIDPHGPHEVEVQKLIKQWKKRPASPANAPLGTVDPAPRSVEK